LLFGEFVFLFNLLFFLWDLLAFLGDFELDLALDMGGVLVAIGGIPGGPTVVGNNV